MLQLNKQNRILLVFSALLIGIGLIGPYVELMPNKQQCNSVVLNLTKPSDPQLLDSTVSVIDSLKSGNGSKSDCLALASLYNDIATLIELDNSIIKNTEEIREANRLSGGMLKLDIKNKYPGFSEAATNLVVKHIGDDNVVLSEELRQKSAEAFRALAWSCNEVTK